MSDLSPVRGGIYTYQGIRRSDFVVVSINALNDAGTVIVCEVSDRAPGDVRGLLAVELNEKDPSPGRWVLCWRVNYASADRFEMPGHGVVSDETMGKVVAGLRSAIEPL
ncbi:MAG TPA: type II toxin-antitoxin system PemK/MazF family toxin [Micromonosporaceae bacterium]